MSALARANQFLEAVTRRAVRLILSLTLSLATGCDFKQVERNRSWQYYDLIAMCSSNRCVDRVRTIDGIGEPGSTRRCVRMAPTMMGASRSLPKSSLAGIV
jgi:hypothetical protein